MVTAFSTVELSIMTIRNVISERDKLKGHNTGQVQDKLTFPSPQQRYRQSRKTVTPDRFDIDAIRRKICTFYEWKEHLTITKLLKSVRDDGLFNGQRTMLRLLLKDLGYKYKKIEDRQYYYEQAHIIEQRRSYLCKMRQNRINIKTVVFLRG